MRIPVSSMVLAALLFTLTSPAQADNVQAARGSSNLLTIATYPAGREGHLITFPDSTTMSIDCASGDITTKSHSHYDHCATCIEVGQYNRNNVVPGQYLYDKDGVTVQVVAANGRRIGQEAAYVACPASDENAVSLGLLVSYGGFDYLTAGDLLTPQENLLGFALVSLGVNVDVLKLSHHGSKSSSSLTYLQTILPEYAVVTGSGSSPYEVTLNNLRDAGVKTTYYARDYDNGDGYPIFRANGDVVITTDGNTFTFSGGNPFFSHGPYPVDDAVAPPIPGPGLQVPFVEDFEGVWSNGAPNLWTKEQVSGSTDWTRATGGLYGHPPSAHGGTYTALLAKEDWSGPITRLISPRLDFRNNTRNAELTFWHFMEGFNGDQDELAVYYRVGESAPWTLLATYNSSVPAWTEKKISLPNPTNGYYICFQGNPLWGYGICIDDLIVSGEPSMTVLGDGDYNGDGTSDIAIFRGSAGLWSVRGISRVYYGSSSDIPIPGDYNGDNTTDIGIFRGTSGLWGVRGVTRVYFGSASDVPVPGDYDGDGSCDIGIYRSGLWAVRGVTRAYFGTLGDLPVPGDYQGDGSEGIALFRPGSGMWAIQGLPRVYFGNSTDSVVPGDYNGDGTTDVGIYRGTNGLWAIRGTTRVYYGSSIDIPEPGDYDGDGTADIGIFRDSSGLWAIRGITRVYFGSSVDIPAAGYYNGDIAKDIGIFRASSGLWAIRGISRIYFGSSSDTIVPGDYDGDGAWDYGIFRDSSGLWAIRGVTRSYFGSSIDDPVPADYNGDSRDDIGIFRDSSGLWAVRGISRVYFGSTGDVPVTR